MGIIFLSCTYWIGLWDLNHKPAFLLSFCILPLPWPYLSLSCCFQSTHTTAHGPSTRSNYVFPLKGTCLLVFYLWYPFSMMAFFTSPLKTAFTCEAFSIPFGFTHLFFCQSTSSPLSIIIVVNPALEGNNSFCLWLNLHGKGISGCCLLFTRLISSGYFSIANILLFKQ